MTERFYTVEECRKQLARAQAEMIVWMSLLSAMEDDGDFVMIDEAHLPEPLFRIAKKGMPLITKMN